MFITIHPLSDMSWCAAMIRWIISVITEHNLAMTTQPAYMTTKSNRRCRGVCEETSSISSLSSMSSSLPNTLSSTPPASHHTTNQSPVGRLSRWGLSSLTFSDWLTESSCHNYFIISWHSGYWGTHFQNSDPGVVISILNLSLPMFSRSILMTMMTMTRKKRMLT